MSPLHSSIDGMKRDLVERLREKTGPYQSGQLQDWADLSQEAAEEIERLRHDLERAMANHNADLNE